MKSAKLIIVLTITTLVSGVGLALLNSWAQPQIEAYRQKVLEQAIYEVLPGIEKYKVRQIDNTEFYEGINAAGEVSHVAFKAVGNGFQSQIRVLVGMDTELEKIIGINLLQQAETPGLGTKIASDPTADNPNWFMNQFEGLRLAERKIDYVKNQQPDQEDAEIKAITGATISSESVVKIVNKTIQKNRKIYKPAQE